MLRCSPLKRNNQITIRTKPTLCIYLLLSQAPKTYLTAFKTQNTTQGTSNQNGWNRGEGKGT